MPQNPLDWSPVRSREYAQCGSGSAKRWVRFADQAVPNAGLRELARKLDELVLVLGGENDCMCVGGQTAGRRLAGGVYELSAEIASSEVVARDAVVVKGLASSRRKGEQDSICVLPGLVVRRLSLGGDVELWS